MPIVVKSTKKGHHTGIVKKSITINVPKTKVWSIVGNYIGLPKWLIDVKKTTYLSSKKKGIGAIRKIVFVDGNILEEHAVAWKDKESFTYIATEGLPLRAYVATISIKSKSSKSTTVTWQSYINSKKMTKQQFNEFLVYLGTFYEGSLENLKSLLEQH